MSLFEGPIQESGRDGLQGGADPVADAAGGYCAAAGPLDPGALARVGDRTMADKKWRDGDCAEAMFDVVQLSSRFRGVIAAGVAKSGILPPPPAGRSYTSFYTVDGHYRAARGA